MFAQSQKNKLFPLPEKGDGKQMPEGTEPVRLV